LQLVINVFIFIEAPVFTVSKNYPRLKILCQIDIESLIVKDI